MAKAKTPEEKAAAKAAKEAKAAEKKAKAEESSAQPESQPDPELEKIVQESTDEISAMAEDQPKFDTTTPLNDLPVEDEVGDVQEEASQEEAEIQEAAESDSVESLNNPADTGRLKLGKYELTAQEEQSVRQVAEIHFKAKQLRFRGSSLTQDKLDSLLTDGSFLGRLGYLRAKLKTK